MVEQSNAAMHNPMADGGNSVRAKALVDVSSNRLGGLLMRLGLDRLSILSRLPSAFGDELRSELVAVNHWP